MPHQCTTCGRTFPDGSKEMLSGCPDCGGNKFQFKPSSAIDEDAGEEAFESPPSGSAAADRDSAGDADTAASPDDAVGSEAAAGSESSAAGAPDPTPADADSETPVSADDASGSPDTSAADGTEQIADRSDEDVAQASARSDVVSPDELDRASREVETDDAPPEADEPRPGLDALRDELNEQFESIRIVSPGKYELNLMELYDRQEYIISLQEDGRYVIEMPDAWGIDDDE